MDRGRQPGRCIRTPVTEKGEDLGVSRALCTSRLLSCADESDGTSVRAVADAAGTSCLDADADDEILSRASGEYTQSVAWLAADSLLADLET